MMTKYLIITLFVNLSIMLYCEQITFTYKHDTYTVNLRESSTDLFEGISYDYELIDTVGTTELDSIFTVTDERDSIFVFVRSNYFMAYCLKQNGEYNLLEFQPIPYAGIIGFFYVDINNDRKKDLVSVYGGEGVYWVTIMNMENEQKRIKQIYDHQFDFYEGHYPAPTVKMKKDRLYLIYGYSPYMQEQIMKYGVIEYSKDKSKEIYFKPISIITKRQWEKL